MMEILTIAQMRTQYPDEWVLVGNPELDDETSLGSIVDKLVRIAYGCRFDSFANVVV
jgi:hypothetical protein